MLQFNINKVILVNIMNPSLRIEYDPPHRFLNKIKY
jgi:hypothetical protein